MDIPTITAALSGIKAATEIAKALSDTNHSLEKAELKLRVASLIEALADAKLNIVDVRALLDEKDREIALLKKCRQMVFDGDVYWSPVDDGKQEGPFCPHCHDTKQIFVRLHKDGQGWWCYGCNTHFGDSSKDF
jgi:hypothetical protein